MTYHKIEDSGLCLHCSKVCPQCNQCRCEIGRKRRCPNFNVKKNPVAFEHWKLDLEIEEIEQALDYGRMSAEKYKALTRVYMKKIEERNQLANPDR